jgi:hypothetical protein
VGHIATAEVVAFHDAFEPAAFGDADGIDALARGKDISDAEDVSGFDFLVEVPEFADAFHGGRVVFFEVAEQGFGNPPLLLIIEAELDSLVAILLEGAALDDAVGSAEDDGYGHDVTGRVVNPGVS